MRRGRLSGAMVCLLACIAVAAFVQAGPPVADPARSSLPRPLKVVMDDNYPPYVFRDGTGKVQGILIDRWRLWEQKTGMRAEIHAMDWGEALRRMMAGEFDVIDTIFRNAPREASLNSRSPTPGWMCRSSFTRASPGSRTGRP
jgi:two-component system cell cycle sensor histidine kinase/response regulator CckA